MNIEYLGFAAAALTSLSFIPQAILVLRTRNTEGLSLAMYSAFTLGVGLWLIYGLIIKSWPLLIANIITFFFAFLILCIVAANHRKSRLGKL